MIHCDPGWLGSRLNVIVINIVVKVYGENAGVSQGEGGSGTELLGPKVEGP